MSKTKTTKAEAKTSPKAKAPAKKPVKGVAKAPAVEPAADVELPTLPTTPPQPAETPTATSEATQAPAQTPKTEKLLKAPKPPKVKKVSGLDAAAQVLADKGEPMTCGAIIEQMLARGLWSTKGKTPAATLYSAILREIDGKPGESRFAKTGRGLFALTKQA